LYDHYVPFDTDSLKRLFHISRGKKSIDKTKDDIWNELFDFNSCKINKKKKEFNYRIQTDGFAVSVEFVSKQTATFLNARKKYMQECKKRMKGLTKEEKDELRKKQEEEKKARKATQKKKEKKPETGHRLL